MSEVPADDGNDSGFEDGSSIATELDSSQHQQEENERMYPVMDNHFFAFPNDDREQERLRLNQHLLRVVTKKTYSAPVLNPARVLEVGPGAWAIQVADEFPYARVQGFDFAPTQPTSVPPNAEFLIDNLNDDWAQRNKLDLVHLHDLHNRNTRWGHIFGQAHNSLKPGGWAECLEWDLFFQSDDGSVNMSGEAIRWCRLISLGFSMRDASSRADPETRRQQMERSGFINCTIEWFKLPIGCWPKDRALKGVGKTFLTTILDGLCGMSLRIFTKVLGWERTQLELLLMDVKKELRNRKTHAWCGISVVYGQKPP